MPARPGQLERQSGRQATKARKPVALKFDDGTELKVTSWDALRRYAVAMCLKEKLENPDIDWSTQGPINEKWALEKKARRQKKSETNRKNAKMPRKATTRAASSEKVCKFVNDWMEKYRQKRGVWKAAVAEFGVSAKRLKIFYKA